MINETTQAYNGPVFGADGYKSAIAQKISNHIKLTDISHSYKELTIALLWSKFHVNSIIGFQKFIESLSIEIKYDLNIWFLVIVPIIDISIFFIITIILILLFIIRINRHKY